MIDLSEILENDILWQMSSAERASIFYLISKLENKGTAIEIGSYKGGSLRVLSRFFKKVYSLDVNHDNIVNKEQYGNVKWVKGDSKKTLPALIKRLNKSKESVNLILIDGDHSYEGVLKDIESVLEYKPIDQTILLIHDSWFRPSRDAISKADWNSNPHVRLVEKDLVTGDLMSSGNGNIFVGGLALVIMTVEQRTGAIEIGQACDYMFRVCAEKIKGEST